MTSHHRPLLLGRRPPGGIWRLVLAAPAWLYRLRLGFLLGHRFLLLTHRGRRTGRVHEVPIEVVRFNPSLDESVVVAAWGDRTQWYRNVQAGLALLVDTAGHRFVPEVRILEPDEVYESMRAYIERNRWATGLAARLFGLRFDGSARDQARILLLRGVAFRPAIPPAR